MSRYYYDLHTHSCLSPCADNDNTPYNLVGMAAISGIDILALTDHNTCKNCPAFFKAAEKYGVTAVAGMELTTAEEIHVVCLFEELQNALLFDKEIDSRRLKIKNREDIFGEQLIMGEDDMGIGIEEFLLSVATTVSLDEVPRLVEKYGGVCYPAHIDRQANSIITVLGTIPETPKFNCFEIHDTDKIKFFREKYKLHDKKIIISSDAHYLEGIKDKENYFELGAKKSDSAEIRAELFKELRR